MDWIKADRDIIEVIYLITAGPLLLLVACLGLSQLFLVRKQIKIAKETASITNQRESFKLAAEQCIILAEKIFPLVYNFDKMILSQPFYKNIKLNYSIERDRLQVIYMKQLTNEEKEEIKNLISQHDPTDSANALDGFAMYFTSGIASEDIAFHSCGKGFCTAVEIIMPVISGMLDNGYFKDLNKLYGLWKDKLQALSLNEQKQRLEAELASKNTGSIKSLGVD